MTKQMFNGIGFVLLFSFFAYVFYPKPEQLILLLLVGIMPLLPLAFAARKIEEAQLKKDTARNKIYYYGFQLICLIYLVAFLLVFCVSWFEKKLIFNILQTSRGKAYVLITLMVGLLFLLYSGFFFIKHRRWPRSEDMAFKDKSRNLTHKEIKIVVFVILLLLFSMFGYIMYFIFSGNWDK